jgi:hypothetical protein
MKNLSNEPHHAPDPILVKRSVYGGVICDLDYALFWSFFLCQPWIGVCWLADLPLSFVADTATLPITIPASIRRPPPPPAPPMPMMPPVSGAASENAPPPQS